MNDTVRQLWEILTPKARRRFFTVLLLVLSLPTQNRGYLPRS